MTNTTDDAGSARLEVSDKSAQSACNGLLVSFHRYRDALKSIPLIEWDDDKIKQWESDREFLTTVYLEKKTISFEYASNYAHDQLFKRCVGITN